MMNEASNQLTQVIAFINQNYVKKSEELQLLQQTDRSFDVDVMKHSARTYRRMGMFTGFIPKDSPESVSVEHEHIQPLLTIFHSTHVKKTERELLTSASSIAEERLNDWLQEGWIYRKTEYAADGKTTRRTFYVMGLALCHIQQQLEQLEQETMLDQIEVWSGQCELLLGKLAGMQGVTRKQQERHDEVLASLHAYIHRLHNALADARKQHAMTPVAETFGVRWRDGKLSRYVEFVLALAMVRTEQAAFDWKQIGAAYYGHIGGSKAFDGDKDDFLNKLEGDLELPLHFIGLVSLGAVTPILFAGDMRSNLGVQYPQGYMHATTDLTVFDMTFSTSCRNVWLVENRAILTRMCVEPDFLSDTDSLVIGLDGQLRSGHRKLIKDVLASSLSIVQVLVWCDTDRAGGIISEHVRELLPHHSRIAVKWILSHPLTQRGEAFTAWEAYERELQEVLDKEKPMEQEELLGGVELWKTWISG
ncbi:hypothetical protein [Paenibacillus sp. OSY-SE]|uniref:hypothetical protein n=1 Tax=Paenibacillus sp. OSY-SE TaxID=1196323 RepID=UPI000375ADBF|nr:hypothetical protein [Paenibacillus sp. OSY-SE]